MNTSENFKDLHPLDIVIFHVGGVGGYGPVKNILRAFPRRSVVVCFEANPSPKDLLIQEQYKERGVRTLFVGKCIGSQRGTYPFYVNKRSASSSIFPVAPEAAGEHMPGVPGSAHTWGENCEVDHVAQVATVTLDELIASGEVPVPDILSMDTQGSEMPIMRGGREAMKNMLSVVCEVDFIELYKGQELFPAQQTFLADQGFRLADLLNTQYWHPGPAAGKGFLTMGEAVYFRGLQHAPQELPRLIKLAAIAYAFDRVSYSSKIIQHVIEKFGDEARTLLASEPAFQAMIDAHAYIQDNEDEYWRDKHFFYRRNIGERAGDAILSVYRFSRRLAGRSYDATRRFLRRAKQTISHA